jgi:hypothetical protein
VLTTLAAALVLVGGADLASYAVSGSPLVLGRANATAETTTVTSAGTGPALSLVTRHAPPLSVSSGRMVRRLNAERVGGRTAAQLEPDVITYRLGTPGRSLTADQHFVSVPSPGGTYRVSVTGLWQSDTAGDKIQCVVLDPAVYASGDVGLVYALVDGVEGDDQTGDILNQTQYVTLRTGRSLTVGCDTSGDRGVVTVAQPITFTFAKVTQSVRHGTPTTVPRGVLERISAR